MELDRKSTIELIIIILILADAILLLTTIFYSFPSNIANAISIFDLFVCFILFLEYISRMRNSANKIGFVKSNWLDIIVMLPDYLFNTIFAVFGLVGVTGIIRLIRLIRVGRVLILFRKEIKLFTKFIKETHLDRLLMIVIILVIGASIAFFVADDSANTFGDGLWYVLVTLSTVGYGDIVPSSNGGRIIGMVLIIVGVLAFSILTGAISSTYTKRIERETKMELEHRLDGLEEKIDDLHKILDELKKNK